MQYILLLPLLWLLAGLSVLLHELGHALGFRIGAGKKPWRVLVGSGPELFTVGRFTAYLIPVGGFFLPVDRDEPQTKKGKILMLLGGPLASLLLAALFFVLRFFVFVPDAAKGALYGMLVYLITFLLLYNFLQFLVTALPIRYRVVCRGMISDGRQIVRVLRNKDASKGEPQ